MRRTALFSIFALVATGAAACDNASTPSADASKDEFCQELVEAKGLLLDEPARLDASALESYYQVVNGSLAEMAESAPQPVKNDVDVVRASYRSATGELEKVNFDISKVEGERPAAFKTAEFDEAATGLDAYAEKECGYEPPSPNPSSPSTSPDGPPDSVSPESTSTTRPLSTTSTTATSTTTAP